MKAIITVGISGSGKTTFAEELAAKDPSWDIICRDDIRFPDGNRDYYNYRFKRSKENRVTEVVNNLIEMSARHGRNVIIADTNLNNDRRFDLELKLTTIGYEVETKFFDVPLQEAIKRDRQRKGGVGEGVILRQWLQLNRDIYHDSEDGIKTYIFDIDGTVANNDCGRGWYEWNKVYEDSVHQHVMTVAKSLHETGNLIVFLSGRDSVCREETERWLNDNFGENYLLYMRNEGDMRRDSIVKEELFNHLIDDCEVKIMGVFDDRPQVIKECWMKLGVPVFCVGNPYEDF